MIDLSVLDAALATLRAGLDELATMPDATLMRDGCIQRFEYCYEMSHKTLRRYLRESEASDAEQLSLPEAVRLAYRRGWLPSSWDVWSTFRDARNITSHTYDKTKADTVMRVVPRFLDEAMQMSAEITRRQAA